jgi:hypothetical protein
MRACRRAEVTEDRVRRGAPRGGDDDRVLPLMLSRVPSQLSAAEVVSVQRVIGNRGTAAWLAQRLAGLVPAAQIQRCGEPGCDCAEEKGPADLGLQRDKKDAGADASSDAGAAPVVVPPVTPIGTVVPYVVRDPSIGVGGPLVADLSALKAALMRRTDTGPWSLMLSIHGSGDRLAAQAPPDWQANAEFYDGAKIKSLFGDKAFTDWRDQYGPTRVVLVACQVSQSFNQLVVDTLSRSGKGLGAGGLGPGCKPIARSQPIAFQAAEAKAESTYNQRAQYNALNPNDKATFEGMIRDLNNKWGYFGAPPVPDADLLRYFFDEAPKGFWVIVEVNKKYDPNSDVLTPLGTPYWNRWSDRKFLHECNPMAHP